MNVLGISTSSKNPSASVVKTDGGNFDIASFVIDTSGASHSKVLMGLIENALSDADITPADLDSIAVDIGPGSFTGVRIGVSCANAIAYALGIPVIPVCSLAALKARVPGDGTVASLIDCRNGNCYAAVYENGAELIAPCAAVTEDIMNGLPENAIICGDTDDSSASRYPDAEKVLIEAASGGIEPVLQAVPMYLRPSQAERMKVAK